ncbi:hypothetical protein NDU88_000058 [Pleurodeles waltl]|uniref:Uncharacterized protein n=1 Tax=Pleurodeles waltl TaxID=8319 RepID=A0AAV7S6P3_PLEWA|nr:hypothetical protein NDU88_000058 [Pleurodeles waltl]
MGRLSPRLQRYEICHGSMIQAAALCWPAASLTWLLCCSSLAASAVWPPAPPPLDPQLTAGGRRSHKRLSGVQVPCLWGGAPGTRWGRR